MGPKQNELGKIGEKKVADFFKEHRCWALIIPKTIHGQPFDIIARKDDRCWFLDVKHVDDKTASFSFDRIEPNQLTSFAYAEKIAGIKHKMGFLIYWERTDKMYYFSYQRYKALKNLNQKSFKIELMEEMEERFKCE